MRVQTKSSISINNVKLDLSQYSDGSINLSSYKFYNIEHMSVVDIIANIQDAIGALGLIYVLDYVNQKATSPVNCQLSYMPNSRQDRVTGKDRIVQPFTLKTYCNILNSFNNVIYVINDPHSNVIETLLNKCIIYNQLTCFTFIENQFPNILNDIDYLIAPDFGAYKKTKEISEYYNIPMLVADKVRDPITKEVKLSLNINTDLKGKNVLCPDDISDYMGSVLELAKLLKNNYGVNTVKAYITHAILPMNERITPNSRLGALFNNGYLDHLYAYNFWNYDNLEEVHKDKVSVYSNF